MTKSTKNIIVLLLDTVRASDVYGNSSLSTLGNVSRNATTYGCAVAPGTWTAPTHASLFTNMKVSQIKRVSQNFLKNGTYKIDPWMVKTKFLDDNTRTISHKLSMYGYESVLLSNNPFVTSFTNLAMGFDRVQDVWLNSNVKYNKSLVQKLSFIIENGARARASMMYTSYLLTRLLPQSTLNKLYLNLRKRLYDGVARADGTHKLDRGAEDTNNLLKSYLSYSYNYKPQFIFVNYMEAHENYPVKDKAMMQDKWLYLSGIEEINDYSMKQLHDAYLKRLKYLDRSVGSTIRILREKGLLDNATIVFTSDHGQFFGEHNMLYHSLPPYEEVSRVPLMAANYENGKMVRAKDVVDVPVSVSALHNSILNLASGKFDYLNGNLRKDRYVLSEHTGISEGWDEKLLKMLSPRSKSAAQIFRAKNHYNSKATAIYRNNMKLMHYFGKKKDELYDISRDPKESTNLINTNRSTALEMLAALN